MSSLCCFVNPASSTEARRNEDACPECGRAFGFPLTSPPSAIRDYEIVEPLGRGFYAATYRARRGALGREWVLKVAPIRLYEFFKKDFEAECALHDEVARHSDHLVELIDRFEETIDFGDVELECHVAVLEYVEGPSLDQFCEDRENPSALAAAQIAIDLFGLLGELQSREAHHNDLHAACCP